MYILVIVFYFLIKERNSMRSDLVDAVYGCLIGGAAGDALGAPTEGMYYKDIQEKYERLEEMKVNPVWYTNGKPGAVTDDTVVRTLLCHAIIEKGGRITPEDFAKVLREKLDVSRVWVNEDIVKKRLEAGINPWDAGRGGIPCGCASMGIAPIGIINAGDPDQAHQDAFCISMVNNDGHDREFAAAVAAGIAAAFIPGAGLKDVLAAMRKYGSDIVNRALELTFDLVEKSKDADEFKKLYYEKMLDWTWYCGPGHWNKERYFCGFSKEFVPVVPALIQLAGEDSNQAIIEGANFGRDCDTIASLVGNIVGALNGAKSIRKEWIDICEKANEDLFEQIEGDKSKNFNYIALNMVEAIKKQRQYYKQRVEFLNSIIAGKL